MRKTGPQQKLRMSNFPSYCGIFVFTTNIVITKKSSELTMKHIIIQVVNACTCAIKRTQNYPAGRIKRSRST